MSPTIPRSASEQFEVVLPPGPYPGLRPFEQSEWPIFFGREQMTDEVIERVIARQLVVLHGDSGCGKSSLIRAGVLARLEQEHARGGLTWRTSTMRPANAPLQSLSESLAALDGRKNDATRVIEIRRVLNFGADAPDAVARLVRHGDADHICILIDQFEELFAFAAREGPEEATLLVRFLVGLLERQTPGLYAIVTMRSEFLGVCAQFPGLAEAVNKTQYLLPRMAHPDLLRAIREPASLFGGQIAVPLAERLIADGGSGPDELPLIQHGLLALYRRKTAARAAAGGWRLDLSDYPDVEHLSELLSEHADEILRRCDRRDAPVVERLFRALTAINAEGQAIRRPQLFETLLAITGRDESVIRRVIDYFRSDDASFLSPYAPEPIGRGTLVDISHEALIRHWRKINGDDGWLAREFRDGLVWRSLLVQADSFDDDAANVLSPATTRERERWLEQRNPAWANRYGGGWDRVIALVAASSGAAQSALQIEQKRARQRNRLVIGGIAVGLVVVLLLGFSLLAQQQRNKAYGALAESFWDRLDFRSADASVVEASSGLANVPIGASLNALWRIRHADAGQREAFLAELTPRLGHDDDFLDRTTRLARRPAPILRAALLDWRNDSETAPLINDIRTQLTLAIQQKQKAIGGQHELDLVNLIALFLALQSLPGPVAADQAKDWYVSLVNATEPVDPLNLRRGDLLLRAASVAAGSLSEPQAKDQIAELRTHIEGGSDLRRDGPLFEAVAARLSQAERERQIGELLNKLRSTSSTDDTRHRVAIELNTLLGRTDPRRAQPDLAVKLLRASPAWEESNYLAIVKTFEEAASQQGDAPAAFNRLLEAINTPEAPYGYFGRFKRALEAIAAGVPAPEAAAAFSQVLVLAHRASEMKLVETERLDLLASAARVLAAKLPPPEADAEAARTLGTLTSPDLPDQLIPVLAAVIGGLANQLDSNRANDAVQRLLAVSEITDLIVKQRIALATADLSSKLSPQQASNACQRLVTLLQDGRTIGESAGVVGEALTATIRRLDRLEGEKVLKALLMAIRDANATPDALVQFAGAVGALAPTSSKDSAQDARETMEALLGWSNSRAVSVAAARAWFAYARHDSPEKFVAALVNVLKFPTAAEATDELLAALADVVPAAPGSSKGLGENLDWIARRYPRIDLSAPPVCPEPGRLARDGRRVGLSCPPVR